LRIIIQNGNINSAWEKVEVVPMHTVKACGGVEGQFHSFLSPLWDGASGQLHCPFCCTVWEKVLRYPSNRTLCALQSWRGHLGEEKNLLHMVEMKPQFFGLSSLYPNRYTSYTILAYGASYCENEKVI